MQAHRSTNWRRRVVAGATAAFALLAVVGTSPATADGTLPNPNQAVDTSPSADALAQALVGPGVTVSNVQYTGDPTARGSFAFNDPNVIGFSSGLVMSSGSANNVVGPNAADSTSTDFTGAGDQQLSDLSGYPTFDASVLSFDFVPVANQVVFKYVFASDEYPEWVDTGFNDVFAFWVNGVNCATERQVAGDPNLPNVPVAVNNINNSNPVHDPMPTPMRPDLFRPNYFNPAGPSAVDLELDGMTTVLTCQSAVTPGQVNHMRLAIADSSDGIYDSAVFIQAGSLVSNNNPVADLSLYPSTGNAPFTTTATIEAEDPNGAPLTYTLDFGDGSAVQSGPLSQTANVNHTYQYGGHYNVTLTVSNGTLTGTATDDVEVIGSPPPTGVAPVITTQPADQNVLAGDPFAFTAAASGTPTPSVQWQVSTDGGASFNDIAGAESDTFSGVAAASDNGNLYRAVYANSSGDATTDAALLTVTVPPVTIAPAITTQPVDMYVMDGDPFSFSAAASGDPVPSVQWQVSTDGGATFTDIAGATSDSINGIAGATDNGNLYQAVYTNEAGQATSNAALLTVISPPVTVAPAITTQPTDQSVVAGSSFSFLAGASGDPAPSVQWQMSTDGGATFTDIVGATSDTFGGVAAASDNGHMYRAVYTNSAGVAQSNGALLTVTVPDTTPPTLAPSLSQPSPLLVNASGITVNANASDASGVASVTCGAVDTATPGLKTVTCTATDNAGNSASASLSYVVGYKVVGMQPAAGATLKKGTNIKVSFQLADANGVVSDAVAKGLAPSTMVRIDGLTPVTAKYTAKTHLFTATLPTKTLKPAAYTITVSVMVGGTDVTAMSIPVTIK